MKLSLCALIIVQSVFAAQQVRPTTPQRPTDPYIAKRACPFECCTFREWTVEHSVTLYDKPDGKTTVASIDASKIKHVRGLTGEVILHPVRMILRHQISTETYAGRPVSKAKTVIVPAGQEVWILDNLGEGYVNIWWHGQILSFGILDTDNTEDLAEGSHLLEEAGSGAEWWVQVRTPSGTTGWTKENNAFGDMDSCG